MRCLHTLWLGKIPEDITLRTTQARELIDATYQTALETFPTPEDGDEDGNQIAAALESARDSCLKDEDSLTSFVTSLRWGVGPLINRSLIRAKDKAEKAFKSRLRDVSDEAFQRLKDEALQTLNVPEWVPRESKYHQTALHARIADILRAQRSSGTDVTDRGDSTM